MKSWSYLPQKTLTTCHGTEATNDHKLLATALSTVELSSPAWPHYCCHQISNSYPFDCELEHVQLLCVLFIVIISEMKHKTYLFLRDEWFKDKTETDWIAKPLRRIIPGPRPNLWYVSWSLRLFRSKTSGCFKECLRTLQETVFVAPFIYSKDRQGGGDTKYNSIPAPKCPKSKQTHLHRPFISVASRYFVSRETLCPGPTSYHGIFTKYDSIVSQILSSFNGFKVSRKLFNCDKAHN